MVTPIDKSVDSRFENSSQPLAIFENTNSLEEGVEVLLSLASTSQKHLVSFMETISSEVKLKGIQASFYDPGIKSFDSALRKAKKGYGVPNQIRLLTDPYRGSMILENLEAIKIAEKFIENNSENNGFKIVYDKNTFNKPWSNGYRDINYKFSDINNKGLVGELQLQLCAVKKFTEIAGHKAYEIVRTLPPGSNNIKKAIQEVTQYGYNKVTKTSNSGCMNNISKLHGGRKTRKQRTKRK